MKENNINNYNKIFYTVLVFICLLNLSANAEELNFTKIEQEWIKNHPKIYIGVDPDWAPFEYIENGQYKGIASEYINLISQKTGIKFEYKRGLNWSEVIEEAKNKKIDLLPAVMVSSHRKQFLNFTDPYIEFSMVILTRQDAPFLSGLDALNNKLVGVVSSYVTHDILLEKHPEINVKGFDTIGDAIKALSTGEIKAYVGNLASISYAINKLGITNLKVANVTSYSFPLSFGVRNDWPIFTGNIQRTLDTISEKERMRIQQESINLHLNTPLNIKELFLYLSPIFAILLTFISVSVYKNRQLNREVEQRKKLEHTLAVIGETTEVLTGKQYFDALVKSLAKTLNMKFAFIGELKATQSEVIRTVSIWDGSKIGENFEYELNDTPCENVVDKEICIFPTKVQHLFPSDRMLVDMNVSSYAGVPLHDKNETAIGILVVLDSNNIDDINSLKFIISNYAQRAGVELERMRDDNKLLQASAIFDASDEGFMVTDNDMNIISVNRAFTSITGYSKQDVIGLQPNILSSGKHDKLFYKELWDSVLKTGYWKGEIWNKRKNGEIFPEWLSINVIKNIQGEIINYVGVFSDISQKIEEEKNKRKLQSQLLQIQKMESIGQLTGGIAHDFNNILSSVLGYTELCVESIGEESDEKISSYLKEVIKSGERAKNLVAQMQTFSRGGNNEKKTLNIHEVIKDAVKMLQPMLSEKIEVNLDCDNKSLFVHADTTQLHQLIMNLCINARDAMSGKGVIDIIITHHRQHKVHCASCYQSVVGDYIEIIIQDNGEGISNESFNKLFEPFFTTKEVGKGTGMGLPVVHGIVHAHSGHIEVSSELKKGTAFKIILPTYYDFPQDEEVNSEHKIDKGEQQHILIIDDNKSLTNLLSNILETSNYRVTVFNESDKALDEFMNDGDRYDLVITDYYMPVLTGLDISQSMLKKNKEIPIIMCTGFSDDVDENTVKELGVKEFLRKPVPMATLLTTVSSLLNP